MIGTVLLLFSWFSCCRCTHDLFVIWWFYLALVQTRVLTYQISQSVILYADVVEFIKSIAREYLPQWFTGYTTSQIAYIEHTWTLSSLGKINTVLHIWSLLRRASRFDNIKGAIKHYYFKFIDKSWQKHRKTSLTK